MMQTGFGVSDILSPYTAYDPEHLLFLVIVALTAGLARGFSGFGGALIFMPLASTVIAPTLAVAVLFMVDAVLALPMFPNAYRHADRRDVAVMIAGAILGVPIGTLILATADIMVVRWGIVALVVALLALLISGWRYHGQPSLPLTAGTGFISGLFNGAAQVGGPPVVAYWLGGQKTAMLVRANIIFYFCISTFVTGANYLVAGLFTSSALALAILLGPSFGVGLVVGSKLFGKVAEPTFRRLCYLLIAAAAIIGMPAMDHILR